MLAGLGVSTCSLSLSRAEESCSSTPPSRRFFPYHVSLDHVQRTANRPTASHRSRYILGLHCRVPAHLTIQHPMNKEALGLSPLHRGGVRCRELEAFLGSLWPSRDLNPGLQSARLVPVLLDWTGQSLPSPPHVHFH